MDYWERLKAFKLTSVQRRVQRYKIIYIWKMTRGLVPDLGLKTNYNALRSCGSLIPIDADAERMAIRTKQRNSLLHHGVLLYNSIPSNIRNSSDSLNEFKLKLDEFLTTKPDYRAMAPNESGLICPVSNKQHYRKVD